MHDLSQTNPAYPLVYPRWIYRVVNLLLLYLTRVKSLLLFPRKRKKLQEFECNDLSYTMYTFPDMPEAADCSANINPKMLFPDLGRSFWVDQGRKSQNQLYI
jgi:hypothetical protein